MANKKIVKLAVIRKDDSDPCPFGLPIPFACKVVGELIDRMAPLDSLGENTTSDTKAKIADANMRLWAWGLVQSTEEPTACRYAGKLFPEKFKAVECNWNDTAAGQPEKGVLLGSPFYSQIFSGIGLDGMYSYPIGYYADYNISRNLFYGIYSLMGSNISKEELKKLADKAYEDSLKDKSATKNE